MTKEAVQKKYEAYLSCYGPLEPEARQRLLASLVAEDVVSILPKVESRGLQELLAHIKNFATQRPGAYFTLKTFSYHHDQFLAEIVLHGAEGNTLAAARTYGKVVDGLLGYLIGFF